MERGPFLLCHLLLVVVALMWMPFGCRDSTGVSDALPALRPMQQGVSLGAVATATSGDRRISPPSVVLAALVAGAAAAVAGRAAVSRPVRSTSLVLTPRRSRLRPRAPPLAA